LEQAMPGDAPGSTDPTNPHEPWADLLAYYPNWLAYRRWYLRIPGVQAALRRHGALTLSTADGYSDLGSGDRLTTHHLFRVASHSKTFTAVLLLQLAEQQALRLDDPLEEHLPDLSGSAIGTRTIAEVAS